MDGLVARRAVDPRGGENVLEIARRELELLIVNLGIDLPRQQETAHLPPPYVDLVNQIEDASDWSRSVTKRARRLGYSQRTLSRACIAATGRTAKQIIDDRVLLEAQRLLADDDTPVASIARQLGFTEPATFTRFFHRLTGDNPVTWRQHTRPPSPATSKSPANVDRRTTPAGLSANDAQ